MGILNTILGGAISAAQQVGQNDFNAEQAKLNRDFQREMSNTAFQRQVHDMQVAGLNPALLYGAGSSGASTPSGSQATAAGNVDIAGNLLLSKQIELMDAQKTKTLEEAGLVSREAAWKDKLSDAQLREIESRIGVSSATINSMEYDNALKQSQKMLNEGELKWLDRYKGAEIRNMNASAQKALAEKAILDFELKAGHRMSSSEIVALADTICSILGINRPGEGDGLLDVFRHHAQASQPTEAEAAGYGGRSGYTPQRNRFGDEVPGQRRTRYGSSGGGGR